MIASWDSLHEDNHLLCIGGEVHLKPSTNQTDYQLLSRRQLLLIWLTNDIYFCVVKFGPDASKEAQQQWATFCAWSIRRGVWTIFLPFLRLSCSSLICGKSQCLETGDRFAFTEYNCGLLQNAIQQPPFFLFTDLLVLVGLIVYQ